MILATTTVEDYDRFLSVFSTKGAEKRRQHGSKGAQVFRDPNQEDRVWALFDWDAEGWQSFVSDPEVPPIMKEAGHKGPAPGGGARRTVRRLTRRKPDERINSHTWPTDQGGRDRRSDGSTVVHGDRGCQRRQDGDR